jgi:hypothetical protein
MGIDDLIGKVQCCHALTLLRHIKDCWIDAVITDPDWGSDWRMSLG